MLTGGRRAILALVAFWAAVAEELANDDPATAESVEKAAEDAPPEGDENDPTKQLLAQLTISMVSEVIDERTVLVRDAAAKTGRKSQIMRLGNIEPVAQLSLDDASYQAKRDKSKAALQKLVDKQMIWWKAAPDEAQPEQKEDAHLIVDVWLLNGMHVNGLLRDQGHASQIQEYESELAKNILTAAADEEKKESYKKLEEAMKESEKERKKAAAEEAKIAAANEPGEPIGLTGWLGIATLVIIIIGACTNFGRGSKAKKTNLNKKRGCLERFWAKVKGA